MVVIEFFTNSPLENMISCFSSKPEKVIFLGDGRRMHKLVAVYEQVAKQIGLNVSFEAKNISHNKLSAIVDRLVEIVETEDECCFDLTGGDDLALVATGIVFERYRGEKNIQMQRLNINTGRIIDCDTDENAPAVYTDAKLTAKDYISLYNAKIRENIEYRPEYDDDLSKLWSICKTSPIVWNRMINILGQSKITNSDSCNGTRAVINKKKCKAVIGNSDGFADIRDFVTQLYLKGLVKNIEETADTYSFTYGSPVVKKCLIMAGAVLELLILSVVRRTTDASGKLRFNDALCGVNIDWDGVFSSSNAFDGTSNEIDVLAMQGVIPVFISCKNGGVDEEELYKLSSVATRFGGVYSKKVLVCSGLKKKGLSKEHFLQRARDMGIVVIDNVKRLTEKDLADKFKNI